MPPVLCIYLCVRDGKRMRGMLLPVMYNWCRMEYTITSYASTYFSPARSWWVEICVHEIYIFERFRVESDSLAFGTKYSIAFLLACFEASVLAVLGDSTSRKSGWWNCGIKQVHFSSQWRKYELIFDHCY